ncbi:DNA polymerase IV [Caldalkalibacillus salinus]|uniref:DNA polymerase IV n=1 Tax=Caldalkalibacillus salinus TaxID=2803787 RepID=UPI00192117D4|nr:DNA polymerase IV [Caldalkalibacillus salinus]
MSTNKKKERVIFLTDMQSFYVSVEKSCRPELRDRPVVVAGDPERRSGIILAACPLAKKWGVTTAEALWQAEQKCPNLVVIRPRMQTYIDVSLKITTILETFTDLVEAYSIDEQFLDVTHSLHLFGTPDHTAQLLQQRILDETGVYARVGIGPNKVLAKMACDQFAKKNQDGIFTLNENNMKQTMWSLPVGKLFGIGSRMRHHLERMGIRTIGQLAQYPVEPLKKRWGINGEVLWLTANGIDTSPVTVNTHDEQKAVGHQMTLPRDYDHWKDIKTVLLELCEEVGRRARLKHYVGSTITVGCRGADFDFPTGFHRQTKLTSPTNYGMDLFRVATKLFKTHWDGKPVRKVGVTLTGLESSECYQLNLFDPFLKKEQLSQAMDAIKEKYGDTSILRAASLTSSGQAISRSQKIGGHYK